MPRLGKRAIRAHVPTGAIPELPDELTQKILDRVDPRVTRQLARAHRTNGDLIKKLVTFDSSLKLDDAMLARLASLRIRCSAYQDKVCQDVCEKTGIPLFFQYMFTKNPEQRMENGLDARTKCMVLQAVEKQSAIVVFHQLSLEGLSNGELWKTLQKVTLTTIVLLFAPRFIYVPGAFGGVLQKWTREEAMPFLSRFKTTFDQSQVVGKIIAWWTIDDEKPLGPLSQHGLPRLAPMQIRDVETGDSTRKSDWPSNI